MGAHVLTGQSHPQLHERKVTQTARSQGQYSTACDCLHTEANSKGTGTHPTTTVVTSVQPPSSGLHSREPERSSETPSPSRCWSHPPRETQAERLQSLPPRAEASLVLSAPAGRGAEAATSDRPRGLWGSEQNITGSGSCFPPQVDSESGARGPQPCITSYSLGRIHECSTADF